MHKKIFGHRFVAVILLAVFLAQAGVFLIVPETAHASVPEHCSILDLNCIKEYIIDLALRIIARELLDQMVQMVFSWIQANVGQNVGYILNFEETMRRVLQLRGFEYLNNLAGIALPPEIQNQLQAALREPPSMAQAFDFNASGVIPNVQQIYTEGVITDMYHFLALSVDPRKNVDGLYLMNLDRKIAEETEVKERTEAVNQGHGFEGVIQNAATCVGGGGLAECFTEYEARTPGNLVHEELQKVVLNDFDWVNAADELSEVIVAIAVMLLNQVITQNVF